jgi:hypothetical protein
MLRKGKFFPAAMGALAAVILIGSPMAPAQTVQAPSVQQEQQKQAREQQQLKQQQAQPSAKPAGPVMKPPAQAAKSPLKPGSPEARPLAPPPGGKNRALPPGPGPEKQKKYLDSERSKYLRGLKSSQVQAERAGHTHKARTLEQQIRQYEERWGLKAPSSEKRLDPPKPRRRTPASPGMTRRGQAAAAAPSPAGLSKEAR